MQPRGVHPILGTAAAIAGGLRRMLPSSSTGDRWSAHVLAVDLFSPVDDDAHDGRRSIRPAGGALATVLSHTEPRLATNLPTHRIATFEPAGGAASVTRGPSDAAIA